MRAQTALLLLWCACAAKGDVKRSSAPVIVQALNPSGLRISLPDSRGTKVVIINANINIPIAQKETGQVTGSVLSPKNGFWTLEANNVTLKPGDVVFYWVYSTKGVNSDQQEGLQIIHELMDSNCGPSPTTFNGKTACAGQLLLEENFDSLNASIWKHSIQFSDDPDSDFTTYTDNPENSFVKDGKLHIKATVLNEDELLVHMKLEKCTWDRGGAQYCERKPMGWDILPPTRSAMLTTKGTFSFKFGRVEIRAKIAAGDWLMSRLLLEPQAELYGRAYGQSGKLVISKARGNEEFIEPSGLNSGARFSVLQADIATCNRILYLFKVCELHAGKLFSDEMHLYSVIWTPESIKIRLDDCESVIKPPEGSFLKHNHFEKDCQNSPWEEGTHLVPFDQEFYISFNLLPGGLHLYDDAAKSKGQPKAWSDEDPRAPLSFWRHRETWLRTWKSDLEVDYVKVWAL